MSPDFQAYVAEMARDIDARRVPITTKVTHPEHARILEALIESTRTGHLHLIRRLDALLDEPLTLDQARAVGEELAQRRALVSGLHTIMTVVRGTGRHLLKKGQRNDAG